MSIKYEVLVSGFAEKHYLKDFRKKYGNPFAIPWRALLLMLQKPDLMLERRGVSAISDLSKEVVILKIEFKVAPNESAKSSGNRCIVAQDKIKGKITILLVYRKNNVRGGGETVWWKNVVKENHPRYGELL